MNWEIKTFSELSLDEFHDIIQLRIEVFVIEQDCPYQDLDGKDKQAHHVFCKNKNGDIVATSRILAKGISYNEIAIGRIVTSPKERGNGLGHLLLEKSIKYSKKIYGLNPIRLSAQKHLEKYYNRHNFFNTGKEYLEDGIPHIEMLFTPNI